MKITIFVGAGKLRNWQKIVIKPLVWFLIPRRSYVPAADPGHKEWILIVVPDGYNGDTDINRYPFSWHNVYRLKWLCFTLQYTRKAYSEHLMHVYGKDYDHNKNTTAEALFKYDLLCKTDYFN